MAAIIEPIPTLHHILGIYHIQHIPGRNLRGLFVKEASKSQDDGKDFIWRSDIPVIPVHKEPTTPEITTLIEDGCTKRQILAKMKGPNTVEIVGRSSSMAEALLAYGNTCIEHNLSDGMCGSNFMFDFNYWLSKGIFDEYLDLDVLTNTQIIKAILDYVSDDDNFNAATLTIIDDDSTMPEVDDGIDRISLMPPMVKSAEKR